MSTSSATDPLAPAAATPPATGLGAAKRRQVLAGARQVFGEAGYERASVDLIAARAGVSKATVYNHFRDKQALFVAAVVEACDDMRCGFASCLDRPPGDVEQGLRHLGERIVSMSLSPSVARLYRQAIAEAAQQPEIGRMVFERGTLALQAAVASQLRRWCDAGALRIEDLDAAAVAFLSLCHGDLLTRARLGVLEDPFDARVRASVARAVDLFLRAYRA